MTCIVGLVDKGTVYMGGDSCASGHNSYLNIGTVKVFHKGEALIGVCGSTKVIDLLRYHLPDLPPTDENFDAYLRTTFMPNVFNLMKRWTWNNDEEYESEFLLGFKGKLYVFQNDFSIIGTPTYGYAIGSGGEVACGSLVTSSKIRSRSLTPRKRVMLALEAAEAVVTSVKGPFEILTKGLD